MILRFHLFVSLLHWDLLPFLVQSGLWCLQIIASFEEHFSVLQTHTQSPPWIWVFVCSHCVQTFVAELFLTTFVLFQPRFLSNHNNVAQLEWKVSILQWYHTGWDYLHTSICKGIFFISLAISVLPNVTISHNKLWQNAQSSEAIEDFRLVAIIVNGPVSI